LYRGFPGTANDLQIFSMLKDQIVNKVSVEDLIEQKKR
jgi:hypothetical protein